MSNKDGDIARELRRLSLVIESAVRWSEGESTENYKSVLALLQRVIHVDLTK